MFTFKSSNPVINSEYKKIYKYVIESIKEYQTTKDLMSFMKKKYSNMTDLNRLNEERDKFKSAYEYFYGLCDNSCQSKICDLQKDEKTCQQLKDMKKEKPMAEYTNLCNNILMSDKNNFCSIYLRLFVEYGIINNTIENLNKKPLMKPNDYDQCICNVVSRGGNKTKKKRARMVSNKKKKYKKNKTIENRIKRRNALKKRTKRNKKKRKVVR